MSEFFPGILSVLPLFSYTFLLRTYFSNIFFCSIPCRTLPNALIRRHIRRKLESSRRCRCGDCWLSSGALSAAIFSVDRTLSALCANCRAAISADGAWHLKPDISINYLSFHQHRGETALTRFLSSTSWRGEKQTFSLYAFSITYRMSASLFNSPLFFLTLTC